MKLRVGPLLNFRGCNNKRWHVSVLVVFQGEGAPALSYRVGENPAMAAERTEVLWRGAARGVWRFDIVVDQTESPQTVHYQVEAAAAQFEVPPVGASPQMVYASCNGFSSLKLMKGVDDKNALWRRMADCHATRGGYNILLLGGDQVYADSMWETVPSLRAWNQLSWKEGNKRSFTSAMEREVERFFFELYVERLAQPEVAHMLARVPAIAMWDDHDILDGWGSYPPERQGCEVFQGIGRVASEAFAVFQHHDVVGSTHPARLSTHGKTLGFLVAGMAILALDMRSERSLTQVLSHDHWNDIYAWLVEVGATDHLIVMSSIPVVYPGFDTLERILGALPGQQELEDDLRDHWSSRGHKGERLRLVHRLLDLAEALRVRPTIVSGDVHVAAIGVIEANRFGAEAERAVISQLISSGIVHPAPPKAVVFALRHLFDSKDELEPGITARMTDFPGNASNFVGRRNFLSLEPDRERARRRIWANWFIEGDDEPIVKVLLPMPPTPTQRAVEAAQWAQAVAAQQAQGA